MYCFEHFNFFFLYCAKLQLQASEVSANAFNNLVLIKYVPPLLLLYWQSKGGQDRIMTELNNSTESNLLTLNYIIFTCIRYFRCIYVIVK